MSNKGQARAGGWFAVSREIFDHEDLRDGPLCSVAAFEWLVAKAAYHARPDFCPPLERGQYATTQTKLATAWEWSVSAVKSKLRKWERKGLITTNGVGRCTIVTIVAYEKWQGTHPEKVTQTSSKRDPSVTQTSSKLVEAKQRVAEQMTQTSSKRDPSVTQTSSATKRHDDTMTRSVETSANASVLATAAAEPVPVDLTTKSGRRRHWPAKAKLPKVDGRSVYPVEFERFRDAYPFPAKRCQPGATYPTWRKVVVEAEGLADELVTAANAYAKERGCDRDGAQYTKNATTWLNAESWATPAASESKRVADDDMWGGIPIAPDCGPVDDVQW